MRSWCSGLGAQVGLALIFPASLHVAIEHFPTQNFRVPIGGGSARRMISRPWRDLYCSLTCPGTSFAACRAILIRACGAFLYPPSGMVALKSATHGTEPSDQICLHFISIRFVEQFMVSFRIELALRSREKPVMTISPLNRISAPVAGGSPRQTGSPPWVCVAQ
jgi:hypothetical protein